MKKILIFLNGKHSKSILHVTSNSLSVPFVHKTKDNHDDVVIFAADNGFKRVLKEKIKYSKLYLFGDFDSLSPSDIQKSKKDKNIILHVLPKKKDLSDFACILDYIQEQFSNAVPFFIEIYGGLGKDFDHEYANIKESERFLSQSAHGGLIVFQGKMVLSTLSFAINNLRTKNFSIFSSIDCKFYVHNALYSGTFSLKRPSHGLSNTAQKLPVIIERPPSSEILTFIVR